MVDESAAEARRPRRIDLVIALGLHVVALPVWLIQALLWDFPGQTPEQARKTEIFIMVYAGALAIAYVALFVALIVWWRQGRRGLFASPLLAGMIALFPPFVLLLLSRGVRRALMPPRPAEPRTS